MSTKVESLSFVKKNVKWVICGTLIITVIFIAKGIIENQVLPCDVWAYNFFVENLRIDWLTVFFKVITWLGESKILILIGLASILILKNKKIALCLAGNLVLVAGLNWLLKHIIQRPRPEGYRLIDESGYSFPSGHAMISTAFYGFILYLVFKNVKNKALRNSICIALGLLIILLCCSRVYLGVHYASDVIAGLFLCVAFLIIYISVIKKFL